MNVDKMKTELIGGLVMAGNYGFINMDIKMRRYRAEGDSVIKSAYYSCRNTDSVTIIHIK